MEKIDVAELLRDCPSGMELDCTMYDNCTFERIEDVGYIDILVKTPSGIIRLTKEGCYIRHDDYAKCVIFPKGKTTWEGFQRPFNDGDILATDLGSVFILKSCLEDKIHYHSYIGVTYCNEIQEKQIPFAYKYACHLATEEEKQKLFDAIKENGYKWNSDTKTLEKLIEPKFKVGDRIRRKNSNEEYIILSINDYIYYSRLSEHCTGSLGIQLQDDYELVPDKFDITILKPFDKVLVRLDNDNQWYATWFSHIDERQESFCRRYVTVSGKSYTQIIPYEGNEHLLGKTDDCHEYFKTWK